MPSIWEILDWILYGLIRYVLYWVPLVKAPRVDRGAPASWWRYNSYWDWEHKDDDGGYPDEVWINSWLEMAFGELRRLATEEAKPFIDAAKNALVSLIGYIRPGFGAMGSWVNWLQTAVGYALPTWLSNIANGLDWLRNTFPAGVRFGIQTWDQLWESIKSSVRSWAMARYDQFMAWASQNLDWIRVWGETLKQWRDSVKGWIDRVRYDPRGYIREVLGAGIDWLLAFAVAPVGIVLSWLGPDWPRLQTYARDCLDFYYGLWSRGWRTLGEIVDNPKEWLLARLEQAILDRW